MASNDAQKPLQALPPALNDLVRKSIREYLAGQGRDIYSGGFALEDIAESFEIGVASAHNGMSKLERRNVGLDTWGSIYGELIREPLVPCT